MKQRVWVLADSTFASRLDTAIDKGANIFDPPGGGSRPEFHGFRESAGFDSRPPRGFADGNRSFGTEDRAKS